VLFKDLRPGSENSTPLAGNPRDLILVGDTLYFLAYYSIAGTKLWKTDGTLEGTVEVPGVLSASELAGVGGHLFFKMYTAGVGSELWKTDGTAEGTMLVSDIFPGSSSSNPDHLTNVAGTLYFKANDGTSGNELWKSDGTAAGTVRVSDLKPGSLSSYPANLTNIGGALYWAADNGQTGVEPWVLAASSEVSVVGRQLFYNASKFDGDNAAADAADDGAIATDKSAYLPGSGLSTTASVSSYSRGINGLMIDVANLDGPITADDFTFRVGSGNSPGTWALAPAPLEVVVRAGAGANGSDRVTITWADGAIKNTWLQVTVKGNDALGGFNTHTGLAASDVFYFGSRVGDTFFYATALATVTNINDELGARFNSAIVQSTTNPYDFNRDGVVNINDQLVARFNPGILMMLDLDEVAESLVAQSLAMQSLAAQNTGEADAASALQSALAFALAVKGKDGNANGDWSAHR
jgi:ELWxxDGT repeat protein